MTERLAGNGDPARLVRAVLPSGERVEIADPARGGLRVAVLDGERRLAAALYLTRDGSLPDREWLIAQLDAVTPAPSIELIAGHPAAPQPDPGPIGCVCFDVGLKTIVEAIENSGLMSVEAVGQALSAGTTCGSCKPAIRRLIGAHGKEAASG